MTPGPSPTRTPTPPAARIPFIGANDGASGVALLMEIAHHLKRPRKTHYGVDLVLFDGEELVLRRPAGTTNGEYFLGSKALRQGICPGPASGHQGARPTTRPRSSSTWSATSNLTIDKRAPLASTSPPGWSSDVWATAKGLRGQAVPRPDRPGRRQRRPPPPLQRRHPRHRHHRLRLQVLAYRQGPPRTMLRRQPRPSWQGRHRLAQPARTAQSPLISTKPTETRVDRVRPCQFAARMPFHQTNPMVG